jgi:hypothetical protein
MTGAFIKHNFNSRLRRITLLAAHQLRYIGLVGPRKRRDQLLGDLSIPALI